MIDKMIQVQKVVAWNNAKAALKTLADLEGNRVNAVRTEEGFNVKWSQLDQRVESFIESIENDSLQE